MFCCLYCSAIATKFNEQSLYTFYSISKIVYIKFLFVCIAQGVISELVSRLFGIEHGYQGSIISNLAKVTSTPNSISCGLCDVVCLFLAAHGECYRDRE